MSPSFLPSARSSISKVSIRSSLVTVCDRSCSRLDILEWRCDAVTMWCCDVVIVWQSADVMWRCDNVTMWCCVDVTMWRFDDVMISQCVNVMIWRWNCDAVTISKCVDVMICSCDDVMMRRGSLRFKSRHLGAYGFAPFAFRMTISFIRLVLRFLTRKTDSKNLVPVPIIFSPSSACPSPSRSR